MTNRRHRRVVTVVSRALACELVAVLVATTLYGYQRPSQDAINAQADARASELSRRMNENGQAILALDSRLRVVESVNAVLVSDMTEVKWLGRAAATAVLGQLLLLGFGARRRREPIDDELA